MASNSPDTQLTSANDTQLVLACTDDMSQPLVTFHPFPKLPLEIRDMIWELALPDGRRILRLNLLVMCSPPSTSVSKSIKPCRHTTFQGKKGCVRQFCFESRDHNTILPTLETCRESRRATLIHYPIRLRAFQREHEIRLGPEDVVDLDVVKSIHACRKMVEAQASGVTIPSVMSKIHTLASTRSSPSKPEIW